MKSRLPLQRLACLLLCLTVAMTAACGSKRTVPTREGESPEWMGTIRDLRTFPQDLTPFARLPSIKISATTQCVRNSQFPLSIAFGITVFCVPFFASTGHA